MSLVRQKTVLLTLGRLPKGLDIAESLSKAGCRVIIAEPFGWHLSRVSRYVDACFKTPAPVDDQNAYVDALLEIIHREGVAIVIPVSEEVLHASLIASQLESEVCFFSVNHESLLELHDKYRFNRLAASFDLPVPETHLLGSKEAKQLSAESDFILKPANTCSGKGFSTHWMGDPLPAKNGNDILVQEKMKGALKSTFSICHKGRVIGTVVYRAALLSDSVAVAFERLDGELQIESWINTFVEKTKHSGFIAFDMMEDENGLPRAIECNPRATSGIHFIDRSDIAGAILNPPGQTSLGFRNEVFMYQFWSSLTETQAAVFKPGSAREKAGVMWKAREVNFSWHDPLPLWLMPFTSWSIMKRAFLKGESFGEAAMHDLEWSGEQKRVSESSTLSGAVEDHTSIASG